MKPTILIAFLFLSSQPAVANCLNIKDFSARSHCQEQKRQIEDLEYEQRKLRKQLGQQQYYGNPYDHLFHQYDHLFY